MNGARKILSLVFLLSVLCVFISIDLFHTERGSSGDSRSCPACTFHRVCVGVETADVLPVLGLAVVGLLEQVTLLRDQRSFSTAAAARSPPPA